MEPETRLNLPNFLCAANLPSLPQMWATQPRHTNFGVVGQTVLVRALCPLPAPGQLWLSAGQVISPGSSEARNAGGQCDLLQPRYGTACLAAPRVHHPPTRGNVHSQNQARLWVVLSGENIVLPLPTQLSDRNLKRPHL